MPAYQTPQELYDALLQQPKHKQIAKYMKKRGYTDKNLTQNDGMNFIHTTILEKSPCFTSRSGLKIPYTKWDNEEVDTHNQFLEETKHEYDNDMLIQKCNDYIILLNNHRNGKNIVVIDVDSKEELFRLYKNGLDLFNIPFTLSRNKKLPHFYVETDMRYKRLLGKSYKDKFNNNDPREIDFLFDFVYEKKTNEVYGADTLPEYEYDDLLQYADMEIVSEMVYYQDLRDAAKPKKIATEKYNKTLNTIDLNGLILDPEWETIPYKQLVELLHSLNPNKYHSRNDWYKLTRAIISMIGKNQNPNDFLKLAINFWRKSDNYKDKWDSENLGLFIKYLNDGSYTQFNCGNRTAAQYLYDLLENDDLPVWKKLCFEEHRHIDCIEFKKLEFTDACNVFNQRVGFIGGKVCMFVEYNVDTKEFDFIKEQDLVKKYRNLYYNEIVEKFDKIQNKMVQEDSRTKFIYKWLDSEYRNQYQGGCCFRPPPNTSKHSMFNLFTGFACDNVAEYDNEIEEMTKQELETELKFILDHLRYLSGDDQTEKVYQYQLKYFAHLLKYPATIPRVAIVWISVPGTGKNQFLNFVNNIMGDKYYYSSATSTEILGNFNSCIRGKLLLNLNEFKKGYTVMEALKELITETKLDTREKNKNNIMVENCMRCVISSNLKNPLVLEFKDRRFMVIRNNPITASDEFKEKFYGKELNDNISSVKMQKMFLRYCREFVNVKKDYNFETNIIKTAEYKHLQSRNVPYIIRFVRYWFNKRGVEGYDCKMSKKEIWDMFSAWLIEENEKVSNITATELTNDLEGHKILRTDISYLNANIASFINVSKSNKKFYQLELQRVKAYFDKEGIDYDGANLTEFVDSDSDTDSDSDSE